MQFEEDEARASDEDPEFTGALPDEDVDDEFLVDDTPLVVDDEIDEDEEENNDLAADL